MEASGLKTVKKEIVSFNILGVEVGTNVPKGGDSGHGGRTVLRLYDEASTAWEVSVTPEFGEEVLFDQPKSIEIVLGGDAEAQTLIEALEFAASELRKQLEANKK
ncbi:MULTISPECIES: hypothetical protein [unclassified Paenibacillus]|uniref:hypothetical protein n=1 Tax=unclassified Paenibacillus TaxID=185978 RepID=UPI0030F6729C